MNICMIGCGYVGLVSGTCLADFGHNVVCVDADAEKIDLIESGTMPIYEIGLEELVKRNRSSGRLVFTTDIGKAVSDSLVVFLAVGTPGAGFAGRADLSQVYSAAEEVAQAIDDYKVIVSKSTVPVGTGRQLKRLISDVLDRKLSAEYLNTHPDAQAVKPDFDVVSNPEFLREGSGIEDFMRPNRVVIGSDSESARAIMKDIYRPLYLLDTPMVNTTIETAELIKYASNAFLATKISYINSMSRLCEALGADIDDLARGMGLDRRIGRKFLHVSPGYGGSCFPKDTVALTHIAKDAGLTVPIVEATIKTNEEQKKMALEKIVASVGEIKDKKIAVLGLAFKPNTDDMRDASSMTIIRGLLAKGAHVKAYDPAAMKNARRVLPEVEYAEELYSAIEGADALVLMTEWNAFRQLDLLKVKKLLNRPLFVDLRNIYTPARMERLGFEYVSLGRGADYVAGGE